MIVRETASEFIMVAQHDHAHLSGDIAQHIERRFLGDDTYVESVLRAVYEHDRGWIRLDETPVWNDRNMVPFSFTDYPLPPKLILYRYGIDETERLDEYAGLLCSLHYSSFQHIRHSTHPFCVDFMAYETQRQKRIRNRIRVDEELVHRHFQILQLCDELSLYVCLNEPGVPKEAEYPKYKDGFHYPGLGQREDEGRWRAEWTDAGRIQVTPSLFEPSFTAELILKKVSKERVGQWGIAEAYKYTNWTRQEISFGK